MVKPMELNQIASMIDQTLLKPGATPEQIRKFCKEAKLYPFAAVCINPLYVSLAAGILEGTGTKVASVAGFPLGATPSGIKAAESVQAIRDGAMEVDMVLPVGLLIAGDLNAVIDDIRCVDEACKEENPDVITKVIFENCLLTPDQIRAACDAAMQTGVDYIKTSTGFSTGGARVEDVRLMKACVGDSKKVKAAGGIRDLATLLAMKEAGASRIGTSAGLAIIKEAAAL